MATVNRSASIASTQFTSKVTIDGDGIDVLFDGVDFTQSGFVEILNAKSVTFKNCRVYGLLARAAKDYWLKAPRSNKPTKLVFETCFFGPSNPNGANKMYNLIEANFPMANGSSFSYNYINRQCCTHNVFSVYNVEDDATIKINGNVFEYSDGSVRIGMIGAPKCTIAMNDNNVQSGPEDGVWAGITCIQPYEHSDPEIATQTFAGVTITMSGNKTPTDQQYYLYQGTRSAFDITAETAPTIILNGTTLAFEDMVLLKG